MDDMMWNLWGAWAGEKIKKINILNQNGANLAYVHGQDIAKKLGLEKDVRDNITPFPATVNIAVECGGDKEEPEPEPEQEVKPPKKEEKPPKPAPKPEPEPEEAKPPTRPPDGLGNTSGDHKPDKKPSLTDTVKQKLLPLIGAAVTGGALTGLGAWIASDKDPDGNNDKPVVETPSDQEPGQVELDIR
jgi:outer membrane biosynthesis protein TonB